MPSGKPQNLSALVPLWERGVYPLLKSASQGCIQFPGRIRRADHHYSAGTVIVPEAVHLLQQFCLDSPLACLFPADALPSKRVHLV